MATSGPQNMPFEVRFRECSGEKGNRISGTYEIYRKFDPHRPYQPNQLKKHVLTQVHFPVYLWCTPPSSRRTMQSPQAASAKRDISGSLTSKKRSTWRDTPALGSHSANWTMLNLR